MGSSLSFEVFFSVRGLRVFVYRHYRYLRSYSEAILQLENGYVSHT